MTTLEAGCDLCADVGGELLYQEEQFRVVLVDDAAFPGFCRVIWKEHVREMTDLSVLERILLMDAVWHTEAAIREVMLPDKINVASLGNVVPHLHWHVIPRYADDARFPDPVWGAAARQAPAQRLAARQGLLSELRQTIRERFASVG